MKNNHSAAASRKAATAALLLSVLASPAAATLRCGELVVEGHKFDLHELGGPHTVVTSEYDFPSWFNTTYTLDLCAPLKRKGEVKEELRCHDGARVCAIQHMYDPDAGKDYPRPSKIVSIAGDLAEFGGAKFDWQAKRLSTSTDKADEGKEGVRLTMSGGRYAGKDQEATVELLCDHKRTGKEGEWESQDEYVPGKAEEDGKSKNKSTRRRAAAAAAKEDDDKKDGKTDNIPEKQRKKEDAALIWDGYKKGDKKDTLMLTWHTKFACESAKGGDDGKKGDGDKDKDKKPADPPSGGEDEESSHWGLFTWLVILVFLAIASYLIFGSWLNYNRYGARGWDLLPHGDTLRDIPYLLGDWTRRVLNTVQNTGSRGGYSAV